MEADPNPFPKFDLFPRLTKVARAIGGLFTMHQLASHGDHFNRGGGPALDRALYEQPEYENAGSYYFKGEAVTEHPDGWGQLNFDDD